MVPLAAMHPRAGIRRKMLSLVGPLFHLGNNASNPDFICLANAECVDTREITKVLRGAGTMLGKLVMDGDKPEVGVTMKKFHW
jgi:hypothetical protein